MGVPGVRQSYDEVDALSGGAPRTGTLQLLDYHLVFCLKPPPGDNQPSPRPPTPRQSWISYQLISQCSFRPTPATSAIPSTIRLGCRDFSYVSFQFPDAREAREAFDFIRNRTCKLGRIENLYAFTYQPTPDEKGLDGWDIYDVRSEFRRQGINEKLADKGWRISTINQDYSFSTTYPGLLVVPSKISDNTIKYAGQFRSRARIPTLTYLHPVNNCTITRSSQPFVGITMKRSIQDERLVGACFSASTDLPDSSLLTPETGFPPTTRLEMGMDEPEGDMGNIEQLEDDLVAGNGFFDEKTGKRLVYGAQQHNLIVDARPAINSYAMQAIGLGSENMEYYKFAKKVFLSIDNIHVMRDSLGKVMEALKDADVNPYPPSRDLLARSGWLKHISGILDGAALIARQVAIQHSNVLVHCSDGWDRTSQLCALAQLMLDPYYRTIEGYIVLIEKDWLSFGHMFQQRTGYLGHEKWFTVSNDVMVGSTVPPGESDGGAGDALGSAFGAARRFFNQRKNNPDKESDHDAENAPDDGRPPGAGLPKEQDPTTRPREISPVFQQFLDATYQLLRQYPNRFEFNERFLRRLLYHVYSCQYGTFLWNNERQRREAKLQERTRSVWDYFLSKHADFTNKDFDHVVDDHVKGRERLMFPRLGEVRWWHQVFNRTDEEMNSHLDAVSAAVQRASTARAAYQQPSISDPSSLMSGDHHRSVPSPPADIVMGRVGRGSSPPSSHASFDRPPPLGPEGPHAALTPATRGTRGVRSHSSAGIVESSSALEAIKDGMSSLGLGTRSRDAFDVAFGTPTGGSRPGTSGLASSRSGDAVRGACEDREMQVMEVEDPLRS